MISDDDESVIMNNAEQIENEERGNIVPNQPIVPVVEFNEDMEDYVPPSPIEEEEHDLSSHGSTDDEVDTVSSVDSDDHSFEMGNVVEEDIIDGIATEDDDISLTVEPLDTSPDFDNIYELNSEETSNNRSQRTNAGMGVERLELSFGGREYGRTQRHRQLLMKNMSQQPKNHRR